MSNVHCYPDRSLLEAEMMCELIYNPDYIFVCIDKQWILNRISLSPSLCIHLSEYLQEVNRPAASAP